MSTRPTPEISGRGVSAAAVAVPSEHGGWSLTLEPVLLGLLVGPSWQGVLMGVVALFGFLMRTPGKIVFVDRRRGRRTERAVVARRVLRAEVFVAVVLFGTVVLASDSSFIWPLVAAIPLLAVELWYDVRSRSRRLIPELAGTVGVGSVATAVALLGGIGASVAIGLWLAVAARSVGAVLFVRLQLRRAKSQPFSLASSDRTQIATIVAMALGVWFGAATWPGLAAIAAVAAAHIGLARRPPPTAPMVGAQQVVFGLFIVLTVGLAAIAP